MNRVYETDPGPEKIMTSSRESTKDHSAHGAIVDEIIHMADNLSALFEHMKIIPGMYDQRVAFQHGICTRVPHQINSGLVRIAVVGAIKSGKSTCVNALVGAEILKRGAGVITSMVTRIRPGTTPVARVFMKSWDEINEALRRSLVLFPRHLIPVEGVSPESFDLRRKKDRQFLRAVSVQLGGGQGLTPRGLQPEFVRIRQALDAYDRVRHLVQADPVTLTFDGDDFNGHHLFTGDGAAAFFADDVLLETPGASLAQGVELADCQGSDSTDPCHLAQIQDYLVTANLIIYVISSRMGLREADLVFLHMIQEMGLMDNMIFVLNVDLGEHGCLEDLKALENQVKNELVCVHPQPRVYTISCLHTLYCALGNRLLPVDRERIHLWEQVPGLMTHTRGEETLFLTHLKQKIQQDRFSLMVENNIQRMGVACAFAGGRIQMFFDLLSRDQERADHAMRELKRMKGQGESLRGMVRKTTLAAAETLETEIRARIHRFFHPRKGDPGRGIRSFIQTHPMDTGNRDDVLAASGFNQALYGMFQGFRTDLDFYMTRRFNPLVTAFIREQETYMTAHFMFLYDTCHMDTRTLLAELTAGDNGQGGEDCPEILPKKQMSPVDIPAVKGILGLEPPRAKLATAYSARIRMDAMAGLGLHSLVAIVSRLLNKPFASPFSTAFANGARRIRKEALRCMTLHLKSCRDALERDYFLKLIHAVSRDFQEKMMAEFEGGYLEMSKIEALVTADYTEKHQRRQGLEVMLQDHLRISSAMDDLHIHYPH
ncbi:dynamin family protein [Desulfocicer niacini]